MPTRPAWVPADGITDVLVHIDLVGGDPQGRAWVREVGEVAVDTLLGSDPRTPNGWSITEYDSADLTPSGYVYDPVPFAYIGLARDLLTSGTGFTARVEVDSESANQTLLVLISEDGADAVSIDINPTWGKAASWAGPLSMTVEQTINTGVNVGAVTLVPGRVDLAVNGSAAGTSVVSSTDRPSGNPLVAAITDVGIISNANETYAVRKITIYAPLPSPVGLSELSQV